MSPRPAKAAVKKQPALTPRATVVRDDSRSVVLQARVDSGFAEELLERDAVILGLDGASAVVREGLRLVHRRALEQALIDSYDTFYGGERAPLPAGAAAAGTD
jgi:hypothetical protein